MALAANTALEIAESHKGSTMVFNVKTSAVIYQHALVAITATGLLTPCADAITLKFVGIASVALGGNTFPVTGSATVLNKVRVLTDVLVKLPVVTAITVGNVLNTAIYAVDDQTGTATTSLGPRIGAIESFVATNSAWVRLRGAVGATAAS